MKTRQGFGGFRRGLTAAALSLALVTTIAPQAKADEAAPDAETSLGPVASASPVVEPSASPSPSPSPSPTPEPEPECTITVHSAAVKAHGHPTNLWGNVSDCAAGTLVAQARVDGSWTQVGRISHSGDGFYAVPAAGVVNNAGTHQLRAVMAGTASQATTLRRLGAPTVASAGQKLVRATTNTWGRFDTDAPIRVWTEVHIGSGWSRSQVRTTDARGNYVIPLTYGAASPGVHRWRVAGQYPDGSVVRTKEFSFRRLAAPTASSAGTKVVGEATNAWGLFHGGGGIRVWTEVQTRDGWRKSQERRADANGAYVIPLTYGSQVAATTRWRVAGRYPDGTVVRTSEFTLTRTKLPAGVDRRCMTGRVMCASKTTNKLHWMVDGKILETVDVRYGRRGLETREGVFRVGWKSRHHVSSIYGTAMPYSMFFSGGQAVHYSADFARRGWNGGSGGCINVRDAATLSRIYSQVRVGDRVVVHW